MDELRPVFEVCLLLVEGLFERCLLFFLEALEESLLPPPRPLWFWLFLRLESLPPFPLLAFPRPVDCCAWLLFTRERDPPGESELFDDGALEPFCFLPEALAEPLDWEFFCKS